MKDKRKPAPGTFWGGAESKERVIGIDKIPDGNGGFIEIKIVKGGPRIPTQEEAYRDAKPSFNGKLIEEYRTFARQVYNPQRVFFPCGEMDVSPLRAFPDAEVTLLDKNPYVIDALRRNGINALNMDIKDYKPKRKHDLLILLNPQIYSSRATPHLENGGYVLANNWHGNATQLYEDKNFEKVGTIVQTKKRGIHIVNTIENLEDTEKFFIFRKSGETQ